MKALILAGGKGLELLPLTFNLPKPMVSVGNIPFVFYQLDILKKAGIQEVILSLSYQPRKIKELLGDGSNYGIVIRYTNEPVPLGTAGAVKNAAHLVDKTLVVINGDILTSIDLKRVIDRHIQKKVPATLVLGDSPHPERYGMIMHDRHRMVTGFVEKPRDHDMIDHHVNVGIYVFEKEILDFIPAGTFYTMERDLFPGLISSGVGIYACKTAEYWHHVDDARSYLKANSDVLAGRIALPRFYGLYEKQAPKIPPTSRIDDRSFIDDSCLIKPGVDIENSVIGKNCRIEERVQIRNSVILPGTRLKRGARLTNCVVGKNCVLGESVCITNGAVLGDKSFIPDYSKF